MASTNSSQNNQTLDETLSVAAQVLAIENTITLIIAIIVIAINFLGLIFVLFHKTLRNREVTFISNIFTSSIGTGIIHLILIAQLKIDMLSALAVQNAFVGAFNWQITMLTVHRFLRVYIPLKYKRIMTTTIIVSINIIAWLIPFIASFLLIKVWYILDQSPSGILAVQWLLFLFMYFIPCIITLSLYMWILYLVVSYSKTAKQLTTTVRKNNRAYYQVVLITSFYLICWLPFCIYYMIRSSILLPSKVKEAIQIGLRILPYIHTALNPIFYTLFTGSLKHEVQQALMKGQRRLTISILRRQRYDANIGDSTNTKASAYLASTVRFSRGKVNPTY
ncbi:Trace amine-associated receptor 5 [Trichoplax sp. H2]|nr:Trace amine-associated receptor 5 [Trichoplax sp. H2]|eukprot:RDD41660.1 Trace amine-associated receptor 5 [Trichoplax sp. H2]